MADADVDALLEKLGKFAEAVIEHRRQSEGHIDSVPRFTFERKPGSITMGEVDPVLRVDWPIRDSDAYLTAVAGYDELEAVLATNEQVVKAVGARVSGPDPAKARRAGLQLFMRDYIADVCEPGAYQISSTRKEVADAHVRRLATQGQVEHRLQLWLSGVRPTETLNLGEMTLRAPSEDELRELFNVHPHDGAFEAALACHAVVEAREVTKIDAQSILDGRARAVVQALRVWTGKRVRFVISRRSDGRVDLSGSTLSNLAYEPHVFLMGPETVPVVDAGFGTFWHRVREVVSRPPKALAVALRRVDVMVDQARGSDRVLDLCIILEALFQLGDEKQELAYRLSLRTAHFIGANKATRQAAFEAVKAGYNLRSRIAHGEEASGADHAKQEKLEEIVFQALRRYCERAANFTAEEAHKAIVRELDGFLLERSGDDR